MTAIVLPDLNKQTIDDLRARVSKLSDVDLDKLDAPSLQQVGKNADQAIDRLLGRSPSRIWPWLVAGIGLVAVIGAVSAWFGLFRRPAWLEMRLPTGDGVADGPGADTVAAAESESLRPYLTADALRADELVAAPANGVLIENL